MLDDMAPYSTSSGERRPDPWLTLRRLLFLYVFYLACRITCQLVAQGPVVSHLSDPAQLQQSLERFQQMTGPSKAAVLLVGVPLYLWGELLPRELANLLHFAGTTAWRHMGEPALRFIWANTLEPLARGLHNLLCLLRSAVCSVSRLFNAYVVAPLYSALSSLLAQLGALIEWTLERALSILTFLYDNIGYYIWQAVCSVARFIQDYVLLPIWRALCEVAAAIKSALTKCLDALYDYVLAPLASALRRALVALFTAVWDYVFTPLWHAVRWLWDFAVQPVLNCVSLVVSMARDPCMTVWIPVRAWLVDKFYRLWSLLYSLFHRLIYAPLAALAHFVYSLCEQGALLVRQVVTYTACLIYDMVEVSRDFIASLAGRRHV